MAAPHAAPGDGASERGSPAPATPPTPGAALKRSASKVDPEYLLALQKYIGRQERNHRQLSRKKPMPAPPAPAPPPSAAAAWSVEEVCTFVGASLAEAFPAEPTAAEPVVAAVRRELVDGSRLKHLLLEDWERLCPVIGPRIHLMESLKKVGPAKPPAPPPQHPVVEEAPLKPAIPDTIPCNASLNQALGLVRKAAPPAAAPARAAEDRAAGSDGEAPGSPTAAVAVPMPPLPAPQPPMRKLLTGRSKFSNHRLVDTAWSPDPSRHWLVQLWQILVFEVLRVSFVAFIIQKFGLRLQQLPCIVAPLVLMYLCYTFKLFVEYSPTLYSIIVVFPLSFSLNAAYQRREQALQTLASIKASGLAVHLFGEVWTRSQLELPDTFLVDSAYILKSHFRCLGHYLTATSEPDKEVIIGNIFAQFADMFYHVDLFRLSGIFPPLVTVPFNNVINMALGFEGLRVFSDYGTPCSLRTFCKVTIGAMAFCFAPLFANDSRKWGPFYGYMLAFTFFWLMLCMDSIQGMLESPFLTFGRSNAEDDINLASLKGVVKSKKKKKKPDDVTVVTEPPRPSYS